MTVPVTGGSHSVDEKTLHEFHLGFFGFIFTCNFIPVYFSPLPSSYCPLLSAPPSLPPSFLLFLQPLSTPLPFLLRSSLPHRPPVIWKPSPGRHTGCLTPPMRTIRTEVSCSHCVHAVVFPYVHRCLCPTPTPSPRPWGFRFSLPSGGACLGDQPPTAAPNGAGGRATPQRGPRAWVVGSPRAVHVQQRGQPPLKHTAPALLH